MAQLVQPQLHISTLRSHRGLALAALGGLVAAATVLTLVVALGSSHTATTLPRIHAVRPAVDAGPAAGTPSAVAQALGSETVRSGLSLTTNVPALPREDAGPSAGTPSAVGAAFSRPAERSTLPRSLTTNVPAPSHFDAGPSAGTPTAVRDALSGR